MNTRPHNASSLPSVLFWTALIMGVSWFVFQAAVPMRTCQPGPPPPLLNAVLRNNVAEAKRLLDAGEDPDRGCAPFGRPCPLDAALKEGNPKMIQLLRDHGAVSRAELHRTNQLRLEQELPPLVITTKTGRVFR